MGRKKGRKGRQQADTDSDDDFVDPLANVEENYDVSSVSSGGGRKNKKKRGRGGQGPPPSLDGGSDDEDAPTGNANALAKGGGRGKKGKGKKGKGKKGVAQAAQTKVEKEEVIEKDGIVRKRDFPLFVHMDPSNGDFPEQTWNGEKLLSQVDILAKNLSVSVPGQHLLVETELKIVGRHGYRYGLVGRNGKGKSVLLKKIANREVPVPPTMTITMVEQEVEADDKSPLQRVLESNKERKWLLDEAANIEQEEADDVFKNRSYTLEDVYARLRDIESDKAESKAATILHGLGFDHEEMKTKRTKDFSGGWRMRIAIAGALFSESDLVILDEPTNHLDLHASLFLEVYLSEVFSKKSTLVCASHDAGFLNSIATHIIHLHMEKLHHYKGDYYDFTKQREQRRRELDKQATKQEKKIKQTKRFIEKNQGKGKGVAQRKKQLEKIDVVKRDIDDPMLKFQFESGGRVGPHLIRFKEVSFGYTPEKIIFHDLDFGVDMDTRVALVGANGVGKSTLMKLMAGLIEPTQGFVERHRQMRFARFSQHHVDQLGVDGDDGDKQLSLSPVEYMQTKFPDKSIQDLRQYLGRFGFSGHLALVPIDKLSGGQKAKVILAELCHGGVQILLLDEPTNHLDLETIESLVTALNNYDGGIVVISHHQYFIQEVCETLMVVEADGTVHKYNGDFEDYKNEILDEIDISY